MRVANDQPRAHRRAFTALLLVLALAAIAGCGSSHHSGTSADPATVVPAFAPIYAGAVLRPEGSLKSSASAAARALTHQPDPYLRLLTALQTPGSAPLDFGQEVAPWLGPNGGIFLASVNDAAGKSSAGELFSLLSEGLLSGSSAVIPFPFSARGVQGAIVLDTSDASKASSFLNSQAKRAGAHAASYRGVAFQVTPGGIAFALVDRFAVIGSEAGVHDVIDTTLGGPSLARAPGYAKLLAVAPPGALAHVSVNSDIAASASQGLAGVLGLLAGSREANISLVPSATSITVDADALAADSASASGGLVASATQGAQIAGELPGESWLALGLGNVSAGLGSDVRSLRGLSSIAGAGGEPRAAAGLSVKGLLEAILTPLGALGADTAEAKREFQSWMGSAAVFASGSGLIDLKAGIVITSTNPALSRAAVGELAAVLRKGGASVSSVSYPGAEASVGVSFAGLPVTLDVVDAHAASGQTKFVIGLTEASVASALNPSSTLSSSASYSAASAALGEGIRPSIIVDFPTLLGLLESVDLSEEPAISKFVPYLRTLTTLAGGGKSLGEGIERFRLVLALAQAG